MPGELTDLNWGESVIGDYQIPNDYSAPKPKAESYFAPDTVQDLVNSYLQNNREALCKLYGKKDQELDTFLDTPDPTTARLAFKTAFEAKMATKTQGNMSEVTLAQFLEDPLLLVQYNVPREFPLNI